MTDNYTKLARDNIKKAWELGINVLEASLPAFRKGGILSMDAFGRKIMLSPEGVFDMDGELVGVIALLISLYTLSANPALPITDPLKAFRELPGSTPYIAAFKANTETAIIKHAYQIPAKLNHILNTFKGEKNNIGGDYSFFVTPLPKITLHYLIYEADEDFPPSVTCLFSNNAHEFMPTDGLADVGEYTTAGIISLLE